jgi:hypothetical protein
MADSCEAKKKEKDYAVFYIAGFFFKKQILL